MRARQFAGHQWPRADHEELLRAVLFEGDAALAAWRRWRALVPFDTVDGPSLALLPLAGRRLRRLGYEDDVTPRIAGIARQTWLRNRVLVAASADACRTLQAEGLAGMALKGLVLSALYLDDYALRPMGDADLLVEPAELQRAVATLEESGWHRTGSRTLAHSVATTHEIGFDRGPGERLDLHHRSIEQSWGAAPDRGLWQRLRPIEMHGTSILAPSPTDLLAHVLVHGVRGYPERIVRWVADAQIILGSDDVIDWPLLERIAIERRLTRAMAGALGYLSRFHLPIPPETVARLGQVRPTLAERIELGLGPRSDAAGWYARFDAATYLRKSDGWPVYRQLLGVPVFIAAHWEVPPRRLPGEVARRAWRRLRARVSRRP